METEIDDDPDYVKEAVKWVRDQIRILRSNPLPDPEHVEGLISWIKFGIKSGKFTLEELETSQHELHDFSRILLTH